MITDEIRTARMTETTGESAVMATPIQSRCSTSSGRAAISGRSPLRRRLQLAAAAAGHVVAEHLVGRFFGLDLMDYAAFVDDEDPVSDREHLLELETHEQDRLATAAS